MGVRLSSSQSLRLSFKRRARGELCRAVPQAAAALKRRRRQAAVFLNRRARARVLRALRRPPSS